ncbi:MAG: prenyltransferase/squalene oxidase repeat-containing protein [Jatrophihabitantaceae bacterium]
MRAASPDLGRGVGYLTAPANLIGGHYYEVFAGSGFADFGLTIDGALALAAEGRDPAALSNLVSYLEQSGKDASGRTINDWTGVGTAYADGGSIAKEAVLAEVTGYRPTSFAGQDLIADLDATICQAASASCAATGNYAYANSVFSQSLGVIAQARAGDSAHSAGPIGYLLSLQHADGGWPSLIPDSGSSDVDSTAMAVMALSLLPNSATAISKGLTWLAGQQLPDGGFPGAAGDSTNSAALAIQALNLDQAGYTSRISAARAFLAARQGTDGGFAPGSSSASGSDLRASAQAISGAVGTSFGSLMQDVHALPAAARGAKYLVGQLVDGNHLVNSFGADYGLTADLAIALAAQGGQDRTLAKVVGYLRAHVVDYADPAGTTSFPGPYSGAVGKLALIAEITGQNPHAFGGFDLLKTLTDHVCTAADTLGACTAPGDFYQSFSTVSQSLAVLALARGGVTVPAAALARLGQLQCSDGGFSSTLTTAGSPCTSDPDTTSYAAQGLVLIPSASSQLGQAASYLRAAQQADGGFIGAAGENTNSTGLAAQALLAIAGHDPAIATAIGKAKAFILTLQNHDGGFGVNAANPASDVRSTTQAVPALAGQTLTSVTDPVTPVAPPTPVKSSPAASSASASPAAASSSSAAGIAAASTGQSPAGLASTGSNPLPLAWLAALLLLAGSLALLLAARRPVALGGLATAGRRRH